MGGHDHTICLDAGWQVASSTTAGRDGALLSTAAADTAGWHATDLPATVLGVLVERGVYPDPYLGTNLRELPGQGPPAQNFSNHPMPADSPFAVPWWFRTEFRVAADAGPYLRLRFDGVNYRATVWLNGHQVGASLAGAYRVFELDVTTLADRDGVNLLAIEITAPLPCDLAITWVDWNPSPPDKNMGLWRDVWLCSSGPVSVRAPFVTSKLDRDANGDVSRALLTIAGDLVNHSDEPQLAVVRAELAGRLISQAFALAPRAELAFALAPDRHAALVIDEPRLWWPRFMGDPALHDVALEVRVDAAVSDRAGFRFGIREVSSRLTDDGHACFEVNGQPLLIRGAGWAPDLLLRRDRDRDLAQLAYVKALNLNTIRFEGLLERAEILEWCDREGILVIAGWCCCDCWEKWDCWGEDNHDIGAESLRSQVRRVRRHPALLSWWYGSDFPPPPRVERAYLEVLEEERWPNAWQSSAANKGSEVSGPSGLKMEGPYEYVPPGYWLEDTARGGAFGFATEISPGAAIPPLESLHKMLPADHLWPIDAMWNFHAGGQEFHTVMRFVDALTARYGEVGNVDELAQLAQLLTYDGQRAMFEAYTRNKYRSTGVIQWMLNNAWPSMIWHLFDWYLRPGGGFFGTQKACEPLHVMYSYDDRSVVVTNQHAAGFHDLALRVRLADCDAGTGDGDGGWRSAIPEQVIRGLAVPADGKVTALVLPEQASAVRFVDLRLETAGGDLVSSNFYWVPRQLDVVDYAQASWLHAPTAAHADLSALRRLPPTELTVHATRGDGVRVALANISDRLAFFVQLRLVDATGADVLPVLWTDNYVSLLPGDVVALRASAPPGRALPPDLHVEVRGLNVPAVMVDVVAQASTAEPDDGRQAVGDYSGSGGGGAGGGGGVPDLVLDDRPGPASPLGREQTARLVTSIVAESALHLAGPWGPARRC